MLAVTAVTAVGPASASTPSTHPSPSHRPASHPTGLPSPSPAGSPKPSSAPPSGSPSPSPSGSPPAPQGPATEAQPSPEEAAAQARAQALQVQVQQRSGTLATAQAALATTAAAAAAALEAFSQAQQAEQAAQLAADQAQRRQVAAEQDLASQRAVLGRWARAAYVEGGLLASNPTLVTLLDGGSTDEVSRTIQILTAIGDSRGRAVQNYAGAARVQAQAAVAADQAHAVAQAAAAAAEQASAARDAAVTAQRDTVTRLQGELAATTDAAAQAQREATLLADARLIAAGGTGARGGAGAGPLGPGGNAVTGAVGSCPGGDTRRYANGEIPLAALCPIWGAPADYLRADAAYAFNRLSVAYAQQFGRPICVTDSYRPYADQVRIYAASPNLAAVPGTSNHGWGTAADLCGGVESFGTATHEWLLLHAPGFGWFHPAWAEPTGSKPEAWHWEYGG